MKIRNITLALLPLIYTSSIYASALSEPTSYSKNLYTENILSGTYDSNIDKPDNFLDFGYGERVASPSQITNAILSWGNQSNKLKVVEYARSHENRPLYAVYISSEENINRLDEIKKDVIKLSDAREINDSRANKLIDKLPAIAWLAYSIHGNETSGADAALGLIYHLIASTDKEVINMLSEMVVIVDPMMNPDGRDRFAKSLEQYRGVAPSYDDQSLIHTGDWPYGRTNHYYFDLNRDWIYLTQPETQGRVALINQWRPQILVDAHEMGPQDTFMTGPAREPINKNMNENIIKWGNVFAQDQGSEFDKRDWRFYTGEWHEDLYPGYSFYVNFRGTLGILYEQSRMAEDGVKRPEGTIQSYKESVHHQFVSSLTNLKTLLNNSSEMYKDYWNGRKLNVSNESKWANQSFVILPTKNAKRINTLAEKLKAQNIEIYKNNKSIEVKKVLKQSGDIKDEFIIPIGSLIIPNRQPEAPLISAILEFDAEIDDVVLLKERQATLKNGSSIMYDTTAFNFTMMYGLNAVTVPEFLNRELEKWTPSPVMIDVSDEAIMWGVEGQDDSSVSFAARLMEQGIKVRIVDKNINLSGKALSRGSIVILAMDNPNDKNLTSLITKTANNLNISVVSLGSGFGVKDLPDWGGRHFRLLNKPQIAILGHEGFSSYDVGVSWWSLDHHLGIRHSLLNTSMISYADLRRYNTIIMPSGYRNLSQGEISVLKDWIKQGGTLIAHNGSTRRLLSIDSFTNVKEISKSLDSSHQYNIDLQREFLALDEKIDRKKVNNNKVDFELNYSWEKAEKIDVDTLQKRDKWQSLFMPSGAFVSGRVDITHWLTFGATDTIPLLYSNYPVLMSDSKTDAVIRIGELSSNEDVNTYRSLNWSDVPPGNDLNIRMSGLVWPEASVRIANSAYLTQETYGNGQIILFSGEPNFRGSSLGTNRLWLNAVIYGSGLGTKSNLSL
ncbi:M14 family metallopeptidase [Gammaproteobacteria bacterium]|nr:M14 family metallopeptidase [Gammaproteobacteria bacterium]